MQQLKRLSISVLIIVLVCFVFSTYAISFPSIRPWKHSHKDIKGKKYTVNMFKIYIIFVLYLEATIRYNKTDFNLPDIGHLCYFKDLLQIAPPPSYKIKRSKVIIGNNLSDFNKATEYLLSFNATNALDWVKIIVPVDNSIVVGTTIFTLSRFYNTFLWSLNPCRILSVIRSRPYFSAGSHGLYSEIVYSTLKGHLIAGEEAFRVYTAPRLNSNQNLEVIFEAISYSKGCGFIGYLCMPLLRPLQEKFFKDHMKVMLKYINESSK